MNESQKIAHFMRRAAFGPSVRDTAGETLEQVRHRVLNATPKYSVLFLPGEEKVSTGALLSMDKMERQELLQDLAANIKRLNLEWLKEMGKAENQLREKMALFWHGHFAVRVRGYSQVESYVNTLRKYALANFGDLLMAVSKEAAMLRFLNNQQNRKNSPNENFAREVMELFTLGRGNYTETDIKEAARAFTGWSFNAEDEFELKTHQHDYGSKTIFGKTGNWEGEDVIRMILENPQTARFITTKLYRFFVSHNVDEARIQELSTYFFETKYDIKALLQKLFEAEWFYSDAVVGSLIKSPVELIVGLNRSLGISYANVQPMLAVQRVLGQTLFFPPNVSGWAGGRNWIDNSTLATRMMLPKRLAEAGTLDAEGKFQMDDENPNEGDKPKPKYRFECSMAWETLAQRFPQTDLNAQWIALQEYFLAVPPFPELPAKWKGRWMEMSVSQRIPEMALFLTRTPEYQLA